MDAFIRLSTKKWNKVSDRDQTNAPPKIQRRPASWVIYNFSMFSKMLKHFDMPKNVIPYEKIKSIEL